MMDTQEKEKEKLLFEEIRKTLYHCRDFEITNLWQRSVFLFAFLLLCFTGYGCWFLNMMKDSDSFVLKNLVALFIALIGIILSLIWIMMAKGSKAWYDFLLAYPHFSGNLNLT